MAHKYLTRLSIVIPCYNEEAALFRTCQQIEDVCISLSSADLIDLASSRLLFVDDGSTDDTWLVINELSRNSEFIQGIQLSRNRGHQIALLAGLQHSYSDYDASITIDADLQDDISVIPDMLKMLHQGFDIVYGVRKSRSTDSVSKRRFAALFYSIMETIGVEIIPDHADFRLLSQRALHAFLQYKESKPFIRGIIPQLGFKTACVYYDRLARSQGFSKYPFKKSFSLALDGLLSFSAAPLRLVSYIGILFVLIAFLVFGWAFISFLLGQSIRGWTSLVFLICILSGVQMLCLGVIGEYIGRIYQETKGRPKYHISNTLPGSPQDQI